MPNRTLKTFLGNRFESFYLEGKNITIFGMPVTDMTQEELIVCLALCEKDNESKKQAAIAASRMDGFFEGAKTRVVKKHE